MRQENAVSFTNEVLNKLMGANGVTYNQQKNIYLSSAYESAAGNVYYKGMRCSDRLVIVYSLGQGYKYLFLNQIDIYGFNGKEKVLLASKSFFCNTFSEASARHTAVGMLEEFLQGQKRMLGSSVLDSELSGMANCLVDGAIENRVSRLLN